MQDELEIYVHFICPQCGKLFQKFALWLQHLNTIHMNTSIKLRMQQIPGTRKSYCLDCKRVFNHDDKTVLQRHRFSHLPYKFFTKCKYCMYTRRTNSEILRHFINAHKEIYEVHKTVLKKPAEWGGQLSKRMSDELDQLLTLDSSRIQPMEKEQVEGNDLIEKAWLSCFEEEATTNSEQPEMQTTNINEFAVNHSLISELDELFNHDVEKPPTTAEGNQKDDGEEIEQLCAMLFEEIEHEDEATKPAEKLDKATMNKPVDAVNEAESKIETKYDYSEDEKLISIEIDALFDFDNDVESKKNVDEDECAKNTTVNSPIAKKRRIDTKLKKTEPEKTEPSHDNMKSQLEKHINYLCPECAKEFESHSAWRSHVFKEHDLNNVIESNFKLLDDNCSYLCLNCTEVQKTIKPQELQRHYFTHLPHQSYLKCKLCKRTKSSKARILQHLQCRH